MRVTVALPGGEPAAALVPDESFTATREALFRGERIESTVVRGRIGEVRGPAVCELPEATLVVPPGWGGEADADGTLLLERS